MKHWQRLIVFVILVVLTVATPALAQEPALRLRLNRDFGYGGFSGDIQGTFSFRVDGPDDLKEVRFYIDGQMVGLDQEAPWRYQFRTDDFALGVHKLYAVGITASGDELRSNELQREFVPAGRAWGIAAKIVIPLILISLLVPVSMYLLDRRRGKRGKGYGLWGGAICPKCGFPFARHTWAPNMGARKFDRCPHCGKWSLVGRASIAELEQAEKAFFAPPEDESETPLSPDEQLRRQLEESRFE